MNAHHETIISATTMTHFQASKRLFWIALVAAAGVGIGCGPKHLAPTTAPSDSSPDVATPAQPAKQASKPIAPDLDTRGKTEPGHRRSALLVGVTKYDNIPDAELFGPGNDVRLMRDLLQASYRFAPESIVSLTEDKGRSDRRPTRANIERELRRLADQAREGDQIVILLAGHGSRQPADPDNREPDGIDEIFLPADVAKWRGFPDKCPNALVDKEMGKWLQAITAKKAHVWIVFDCCHSGTMVRQGEIVREMPPGKLVPEAELERARQRAARQREKTRGLPGEKPAPFVPQAPSDYLVAVYACRENETTPESRQPADSPHAEYHGLLTYSLADILTKSAGSRAPLTYRELVQRLQARYAARPHGAPTPLIEGKGQDLVVLGTEQPSRPRLLLGRENDTYKVNAGDLYGLTTGSVLEVYAPAGTDKEPKLLGHVRVETVEPFEATVVPCAYDKSPLVKDLPALCACQPVLLNYGLRRFKVAVLAVDGQPSLRQQVVKALEPLAAARDGLVEVVEDVGRAEWLVRVEKGRAQLVEASGNRAPFALPEPLSPHLAGALRQNLERIFRARNLIEVSRRFEEQRYGENAAVDVEIEVLKHKSQMAPGEVVDRPPNGWRFRAGDSISFRITNKSRLLALDVTLLIVGSDFAISPFYPQLAKGEIAKSVKPGQSIDTPPPPGEIGEPLGPECLVVVAVPARNPPVDFLALAQDGLAQAQLADKNGALKSPLGELLQSIMFRSGTRGLTRDLSAQHGMRLLAWRTEPK